MVSTFDAVGLNGLFRSRVAALVHAAIFDAVNSINPQYTSYAVSVPASFTASKEAAAAAAGYETMVSLFPAQQADLQAFYDGLLSNIPDDSDKTEGITVGTTVGSQIIALRSNDGSSITGGYAGAVGPGEWQPTPPAFALGIFPSWRYVTPWVLESASQFNDGTHPALSSAEWAADYNEVKTMGAANSTVRTQAQTNIALFWQVPGTTSMNELARILAMQAKTSIEENARIFALLNFAIADSTIAAWDAKYSNHFWRPITAIRAGDTDGNDATVADPTWTPLLVTPPFPEYFSNHCANMGAATEALDLFFGPRIDVDLTSAGAPGVTLHYSSLGEIIRDVEDARVWSGIHYRTSDVHGANAGRKIAHYAVKNFLVPLAE